MKSLLLRSGLALLCAMSLASCGGNGAGSMLLGGQVSGLTKSGLVLTNNGGEALIVPADTTTFQFPNLVAENDSFDIEIQTQPTGAVCTVTSGNKNTANIYTVSATIITCNTNTYTLGGTVFGLDSLGLILTNGNDVVSPLPPTTPGAPVDFQFPIKVADGAPFGVSVLSQPQSGKVCSVVNGTATMGSSSYLGLTVNCF